MGLNLSCCHEDQSCLMNLINGEMVKLPGWFNANMLSINVKKSNYMVFKPRQRRDNDEIFTFLIGYKIDLVKEVVLLGVIKGSSNLISLLVTFWASLPVHFIVKPILLA